jgi:uncharacterized protein YqjF (DUF2071 family)
MLQPSFTNRLKARNDDPQSPLLMYQKWRNLLFLHWEYDALEIQKTLPAGLSVDLFNNKAYVGLIPFWVNDARPPFFPALPYLSNFYELNFRTYVYDSAHRPGIWFYSLDANHKIATQLARMLIGVPYRYAKINSHRQKEEITFDCELYNKIIKFIYEPSKNNTYKAPPHSLEFFLIERYILFSLHNKKLKYLYVRHDPYDLKSVILKYFNIDSYNFNNSLFPLGTPDHIVFSPGVDTKIYMLK